MIRRILFLFFYNFFILTNAINLKTLLQSIKDSKLDIKDLVHRNNFSFETHSVETEDGYILDLHRILSRNVQNENASIPLLISHGLFCSSITLLDNKDNSLAYIMANENFDVWLGNFRGNSYTSHRRYSNTDKKYWDFSFEEMAKHDLPASIDYIRNFTRYNKILYLGLSMGTLVGFAMFASKPEYNDKVAAFIALAPLAIVPYVTSPALLLMKNIYPIAKRNAEKTHNWHFLYSPVSNRAFYIGMILSLIPHFTDFVLGMNVGYDPITIRKLSLPPPSVVVLLCVALETTPSMTYHGGEGMSIKQLAHFIQIHANNFSMFDYGKEKNMELYGQETPTAYNLSTIRVPIAMFSSANDAIATPLNMALLRQQLKTVIIDEFMSDPRINHVDFMWPSPGKEVIFEKVIQSIEKIRDKFGNQFRHNHI